MYVCTPTGEDIEKRYKYIGIATNNISEYSAAMYGISLAIERDATQITLYADSLLVIEQLKGTYKIKNE
jgi:ribonuclease HI